MTGSQAGKSFVVESTEPKAPPLALQRTHGSKNEAVQPRRADATLVHALPVGTPPTGPVDVPVAPHLVLLSGAETGRQVWFRTTVTTIGRARDNAVVIPEMGVSRHHARFERDAQAIVLRDERSGNGTRVNGRKTKRRWLRDGDVVQVGATRLRFVDPDRTRSPKMPYAATVVAIAVLAATMLAAAGGRIVWQRRQAEPHEQVAAQLERNAAKPGKAVAAAQITTAAAQPAAVPMQGGAQPTPAAVESPRPAHPAQVLVAAPAATGVQRASRPRAGKGSAQRPHASIAAASTAKVIDGARFEDARREGMARMAENKLPEALRAFEEARRENPTPELARIIASLHVRIGLSLMSSEAKLPAAAAELRAALDDEPQNQQAAHALQEIEARCHELYLRGYIAKDDDPATATAAFRIVISALPPEDQTAQKARHWLTKLDGKALIDD